MKRREAREQAFVLVFERSFKDESLDEIIEEATLGRSLEVDEFARHLASMVYADIPFLDQKIERYSQKWKINRISRVALSILRMSICEIERCDDVPLSVSINEAVELAKKFAGEEDSSFVNGVLGALARDLEGKGAPETESSLQEESAAESEPQDDQSPKADETQLLSGQDGDGSLL